MANRLREHRTYIADANRLRAYRGALAEVIRPGDTVVDLGCGTGILGLLALQAGAGHVIAIDQTPMWHVAKRIAAANGHAERVTCIHGKSNGAEIPVKAALTVCDQMGPLGYEAGLVEASLDAVDRFLNSSGRLMPSHLDIWLGPAESPEVHSRLGVWSTRHHDIDFSALVDDEVNTIQILPRGALGRRLALGQRVFHLVLGDASSIRGGQLATARWTVHRRGTLHGIQGWFVAQLSPSFSVTNDPDSPTALDRAHAFLPIAHPVAVEAGDAVTVDLVFSPRPRHLEWHVTVRGSTGATARFSHSSLLGNALVAVPTDPQSSPAT